MKYRYSLATTFLLPSIAIFLISAVVLSSSINNVFGFYFLLFTLGCLTLLTLIDLVRHFTLLVVNLGNKKINSCIHSGLSLSCLLLIVSTCIYFRSSLLGIDVYLIQARSMEPTLIANDIVVVSTKNIGIEFITRNDVVLFDAPFRTGTTYIKRVIATPGDTLFVASTKVALISKQSSNKENQYRPNQWVNESHIFVLGDNLTHSRDSRHFGQIRQENLIGKAQFVLLNWAEISQLNFERMGKTLSL